MKLSLLVADLAETESALMADPEVAAVTYDSRRVEPGSLFVAVPGLQVDGHSYLAEAVARGAVAAVVQGDRMPDWASFADLHQLPVIAVKDGRKALSDLASAFQGYPARKLRVIGVTGTDGKTTTCHLIARILEQAGFRTGLVTTVDIRLGAEGRPNLSHFTTPEAPELQALLSRMVATGSQYAVIETSSHALALQRVAGCEYDVAVLTNVTRDHLDFHGTPERYLAAKGLLYRLLSSAVSKGIPKVRVLNADDGSFGPLRALGREPLLSYGVDRAATVIGRNIQERAGGVWFTAVLPGNQVDVRLQLPGRYNVYNALAALAVAVSQGIDLETAKDGLESLVAVPGRMEPVPGDMAFRVWVDFAHTPAGLQAALAQVRSATLGRVLVVFGCPGRRDAGKRPLMGEVAGRMADFCVLTSDDPRDESPEAIMKEIELGVIASGRHAGRDYAKVGDRREAIALALSRAQPGDAVLLAGKGHETTLLVGDEALPWSDREVALDLLRHGAAARPA